MERGGAGARRQGPEELGRCEGRARRRRLARLGAVQFGDDVRLGHPQRRRGESQGQGLSQHPRGQVRPQDGRVSGGRRALLPQVAGRHERHAQRHHRRGLLHGARAQQEDRHPDGNPRRQLVGLPHRAVRERGGTQVGARAEGVCRAARHAPRERHRVGGAHRQGQGHGRIRVSSPKTATGHASTTR